MRGVGTVALAAQMGKLKKEAGARLYRGKTWIRFRNRGLQAEQRIKRDGSKDTLIDSSTGHTILCRIDSQETVV